MNLTAPLGSWDAERLADWLELKALASADGNSSITDLVRELQRNGTTEESQDDEGEEGEDEDEEEDDKRAETRAARVAEDAFLAIEERAVACDVDGAYPFEICSDSIQLRDDGLKSAYVFFLLLGEYGQSKELTKAPTKARARGTKIFEHMCAWAARTYFGPKTTTAVFGFPRDVDNLSKGFAAAVDDLCGLINEGVSCRRTPKTSDEKDAGLDVVAWRPFPDKRPGKLIAFGQCATGDDWRSKTTELLPAAWCGCGNWLTVAPLAVLMRLFFVPYRVREKDWELHSRNAGIVFDRCRLTHCIASDGMDPQLTDKWTAWTKEVHDKSRAAVTAKLNVKVA